jgi:hypothetical protein
MTLCTGRRHWIVFSVLLTTQVFGLWLTAHRNPMNVGSDWTYFALFAVAKTPFGWIIAAGMVICMCFVTALIMVTLWDTVRQSTR